MRIIQNRTKRTIFLNQKSYVLAILNKKDLLIYNVTHISINPGSNILSDDIEDQKETNIINYQKIIGKLIYLACGTRFDIIYAVERLN